MISLDALQFAEVLPALVGRPRITLGRTQPVDFVLETARPEFKLHLAGGLAVLQARLDCFYGGKSVQSLPPDGVWLADSKFPTRFTGRDVAAEAAALSRLARGGFAGPDREGLFHLKGQDAVLNFRASLSGSGEGLDRHFGRAFGAEHAESGTGRAALSNHALGRTMV